MKKFNFFLLAGFFVAFISCTHSCEGGDPELAETLEQLKPRSCFANERFPNLPTEEDWKQLEASLLHPGHKLPNSLKMYHLTLGNLLFSGVKFPAAHRIENEEIYRSNLQCFIRDIWHKNKTLYKNKNGEVWIPFAYGSSDECFCMNLETERVCYFSLIPRLKKEEEEYPTLSVWLKETLFSE